MQEPATLGDGAERCLDGGWDAGGVDHQVVALRSVHKAERKLSQRMGGITGEQLRRIPEVVAVAGGVDKAEAVGVVLRAGFVTTLITNASVAQQLLKQDRAALTSQSSSAPDR